MSQNMISDIVLKAEMWYNLNNHISIKEFTMKRKQILASILCSLLLVSCGSGSTAQKDDTSTPPPIVLRRLL